jgi:uncharacterized membrane protein YdjX (TVP38/TMEM64 family)
MSKLSRLFLKRELIPFGIAVLVIILTFLCFAELETFFQTQLTLFSINPLKYAAISFFILASDIVLPVPSSVVMFLNGYVLGVIPGSLVSLASLMFSAFIGYFLGRYTALGFKVHNEEKSGFILSKYGAMAILITRGIPILSESICIVCGFNNMPLRTYLLLNLIGYIPLCILYAFFGHFGYEQNLFLYSFAAALLIAVGFWFLGKSVLKTNTNLKSNE